MNEIWALVRLSIVSWRVTIAASLVYFVIIHLSALGFGMLPMALADSFRNAAMVWLALASIPLIGFALVLFEFTDRVVARLGIGLSCNQIDQFFIELGHIHQFGPRPL